MKRLFKIYFVLSFIFYSWIVYLSPTPTYAAEIPYGAGGYCWGISEDEMPDLIFLSKARKSGTSPFVTAYQVNNINSYHLGDYLPDNIKPKGIIVMFVSGLGYHSMSLQIDKQNLNSVYRYLTVAYGTSEQKINRFKNNIALRTERWKNDNTEILLLSFDDTAVFTLQISHVTNQ